MGLAWRVMGLLALTAGLIALSPSSPAQAAGVVGDGTAGSCTEAALDSALTGGGQVTFNCHPSDLPILVTSQKVISNDTQLDGDGVVTLSGGDSTRLFFVNAGGTLDLNGITLTGGDGTGASFSGLGGAIFNNNGTVTMTKSTISSNSAGSGGGIYNFGVVTLTNSTFSGNSADFGGGIVNDGGAEVTMTNTTLSGNSADSAGGGVYNSGGAANLTDSTLSGNSADFGGGIFNFGGDVTLTNSTLSGNSADDDGGGIFNDGGFNVETTLIANSTNGNCGGIAVTSQGGNLSDDTTCALGGLGDLDNTAANLGPLADNGGPTLTHLPQAGSPAIDSVACVTSQDQRGISRPQGNTCDIGAVEVRQGSTYLLCASYWTGSVTSPLSGGCGPGTIALDPVPQSFCVNSWTGQVTYTFGRPCNPPRITYTLAVNEVLLTCVNAYTGANRWVMSHSHCNAYELPNTIAPAL